MDWFSWLSKTNLEPSLIYEYGLEFARNELLEEDLVYFNHEFLLSMGISVAKHRLEILKIAKKEVRSGQYSLSNKLVLAVSKTKKGIKNCISKLVFPQASAVKALPEATLTGDNWRGAMTRKCKTEKGFTFERPPTPVVKPRRQAKSGPLDRRMQEQHLMLTDRSLKLSGPLDGKMHEKVVYAYRSPKLIGTTPPPDGSVQPRFIIPPSRSPRPIRPFDGRPPSPKVDREYCNLETAAANGDYDDHSLWSALFQDMKPT